MPVATQLLWFGNFVAQVWLVVKLVRCHLFRPHLWFGIYWSGSTVQGLVLLFFGRRPDTNLYWTIWAWTHPFVMALQVLAVFELHRLVKASFRGLGPFGRTVLIVALLIGLIICALLATLDAPGSDRMPWYAHVIFLILRCVESILAVLLICTSVVFFRFPEPIRPNVIAHCRILTAYCAVNAAGFFAVNVGLNREFAGQASLAGALVCLILWIRLLSPEGEEPTPPRPVSVRERKRIRTLNDEVLALGRWLVRHLT